jgi:hypothetical protein
MSVQSLNISIEKINRTIRLRFSPHDSGDVKVLGTLIVLSGAHHCAHAATEYRMYIPRATKGAQIEVQ